MKNDSVGKIFVVVSTKGDRPVKPKQLRECVVYGECLLKKNRERIAKRGASLLRNNPLQSLRDVSDKYQQN